MTVVRDQDRKRRAETGNIVLIRRADESDRDGVWTIIAPVIRAGDTYALDRDLTREQALAYWFGADRETYVAVVDDRVAGTYYLRANQSGGGAHVANCGYVTDARFAGRGVARSMCAHSIEVARERGFRAMQFNCVVSTNERAIGLWESFGFTKAGRLPGAFEHPTLGDVDAFVMFRAL